MSGTREAAQRRRGGGELSRFLHEFFASVAVRIVLILSIVAVPLAVVLAIRDTAVEVARARAIASMVEHGIAPLVARCAMADTQACDAGPKRDATP